MPSHAAMLPNPPLFHCLRNCLRGILSATSTAIEFDYVKSWRSRKAASETNGTAGVGCERPHEKQAKTGRKHLKMTEGKVYKKVEQQEEESAVQHDSEGKRPGPGEGACDNTRGS